MSIASQPPASAAAAVDLRQQRRGVAGALAGRGRAWRSLTSSPPRVTATAESSVAVSKPRIAAAIDCSTPQRLGFAERFSSTDDHGRGFK